MLSPKVSIGARPHRVQLQNPDPAVPDGDGGYTQTWTDLDPPCLFVAIVAGAGAEERAVRAEGTTVSTALYEVTGPYHPGVTTKTRLLPLDGLFIGRELRVNGVTNITERSLEMVLACSEVTP